MAEILLFPMQRNREIAKSIQDAVAGAGVEVDLWPTFILLASWRRQTLEGAPSALLDEAVNEIGQGNG